MEKIPQQSAFFYKEVLVKGTSLGYGANEVAKVGIIAIIQPVGLKRNKENH